DVPASKITLLIGAVSVMKWIERVLFSANHMSMRIIRIIFNISVPPHCNMKIQAYSRNATHYHRKASMARTFRYTSLALTISAAILLSACDNKDNDPAGTVPSDHRVRCRRT